jgi:predicted amino acid racemase
MCEFEHLVRSFILDLEDITYIASTVSTVAKLNGIKNADLIKRLELDNRTAEYMLKFQPVKSATEFRHALHENHQSQ